MDKSYSKIDPKSYVNDFSTKRTKSNINIEFNRVAFIFFIFFIIYLIYSIHLIHLGSRSKAVDPYKSSNITGPLNRANIIDINGKYLAKTVSATNIGINPSEVINKKKLVLNLKYIFPDKNFSEIEDRLKKNKFFYIERNISDEKYEQLMRLGDKSIKVEKKILRLYPQKNLFSHLVGQIDSDNIGISGIEKSQNTLLRETKIPLQLTLDSDIQFLVREELLRFNDVFQTKGSAAVLMNIDNGNILSLVSLPDFNPNKRENIKDENYINKITKGVYELGSVFKTFTLAAALDENLIEVDTKFENLEKSINCGNNTIREYDKKIPKDLTAEEILIRSGNIGSVRIGQKIGVEKFKEFLTKINVINKIDFDIDEIGIPIPFKWGKCKLATTSFGHGITTTPLQLAKGYAIVTNGGFDVNPTIIRKKSEKRIKYKKRIIKENVSKKINPILRKIVKSKEGTANLADVKGYEIGGKTGTAEKIVSGTYSNQKKINTFASVFPISNPEFVLVVILDEPKINSEYIYNYRDGSNFKLKGSPRNTSGWTTVEVTGHIIEKIGPILATKYIEIN
ncbi:penicillin-binding protein 2 [Candidatus Pelagibacter bacterium]|nr:penicillin-binding protein 2 [Candidatus Pelagibacter bacterium]